MLKVVLYKSLLHKTSLYQTIFKVECLILTWSEECLLALSTTLVQFIHFKLQQHFWSEQKKHFYARNTIILWYRKIDLFYINLNSIELYRSHLTLVNSNPIGFLNQSNLITLISYFT